MEYFSKMSRLRALVLILLLPMLSCGGSAPAALTIVHFNDVYEIGPVEGGRIGGLARVATIVADLRRTNSPVLTTLGGDFLSPSALAIPVVDGEPIAGRQMIVLGHRLVVDDAGRLAAGTAQ
jgi:5'-nucleotidase